MTDWTLAAKVPTLDVPQSFLTAQRINEGNSVLASQAQQRDATAQEMQSRGLDIQSKTMDLAAKQETQPSDVAAKIRANYASMEKADQEKLTSHLGMLGEAARTVAALPDGSPEQKTEWDSRLDHLHANKVISDSQWQAYKNSGPSSLILNQVMQFADAGHAALGLTPGGGAIDTTGMSPADAARASRLESIASNSRISPQERDLAKSQLDQLIGAKGKPTVQQNIDVERMVLSFANNRNLAMDDPKVAAYRTQVEQSIRPPSPGLNAPPPPPQAAAPAPAADGPGVLGRVGGFIADRAVDAASALTGGARPAAAASSNLLPDQSSMDRIYQRGVPPSELTGSNGNPGGFDAAFGGADKAAKPATRGIANPKLQGHDEEDVLTEARARVQRDPRLRPQIQQRLRDLDIDPGRL